MPRTPDPVGEELNLVDVGTDPTGPGSIAYSGGVLKGRDSVGTFDLRGSSSTTSNKAGSSYPVDFSGEPQKATVVFDVAFSDTAYAIVFSPVTDGSCVFAVSAESKTEAGFVINLNTNNAVGLVEVGWQCRVIGS